MKPELFSINPPYRVFYALSISFCTSSAARSIDAVADVMEHLTSTDSKDPLDDIDSHAVLDELQNIIVQGAAVSRYFWPADKAHEVRGRELREQFKVTDTRLADRLPERVVIMRTTKRAPTAHQLRLTLVSYPYST